MAYDSTTDLVVGAFQTELSQSQGQTVRCFDTYDVSIKNLPSNRKCSNSICNSQTAATHRSATGKKSVTVEWIPPVDFDGVVVFR